MKKLIIIAVGLMLLALLALVCGGGASGNSSTDNTETIDDCRGGLIWDGPSQSWRCATSNVVVTPGPSTGKTYIMDGDGCPDGYTFVQDGGEYGGCTFEPGSYTLTVYYNGARIRTVMVHGSGPIWVSDVDPSKQNLQVFWPGGAFACVKER